MKRYDPLKPPDPKAWLALEEAERIRLVERYHTRAGIKLPNLKVHAAFHVVVENQVLMGDPIPVRETLERLMAEGVNRHDAIHAIGSVLAKHIHVVVQDEGEGERSFSSYYADVKRLTAASWLDGTALD